MSLLLALSGKIPGVQVTGLPPVGLIASENLRRWEWNNTRFIGQDTLPFNQFDWPNPKANFRIEQTWLWNQTRMFGQDILPTGEQVYDLPPRGAEPSPRRSWEWRNVLYLSKDILPFRNDHSLPPSGAEPNPRRTWEWRQVDKIGLDILPTGKQIYDLPWQYSYSDRYRFWTYNILETEIFPTFAFPFNQFDWPLPTRPPRLDQTWLWRQVGMLGQDVLPFNQSDWPLPKANFRLEQTWLWRQVDKIGLDILPAGEQVYDLVPRAPYRNEQTWIWRQVGMLGKDILPFNQFDWPNPRIPEWYLKYRDWSWRQVDKIGLDTLPFNQYDWPLPKTFPRLDQTFVKSDTFFLPPGNVPYNQYYWPLPVAPNRIDQAITFSGVLYLGQDVLPFNQYHWPLPKTNYVIDQTTAFRSPFLRPPVFNIPYINQDWPLPGRYPRLDQFYSYVSPFAPAVVGPAQYFLLQPHYIGDKFLEQWSVVTEGIDVPLGWVPTLAVDPLNTAAVAAFYAAGPRPSNPEGFSWNYQNWLHLTAQKASSIQPSKTHWVRLSNGMYQLTGLGAALPPIGE